MICGGCSHADNRRLSNWAHRLRNSLRLLRSVLGEIFDESAYSRFLRRQQLTASPQSYAAFLREHELSKARRPRCC